MAKTRLVFFVVLGTLINLTFAQEPNSATSAGTNTNVSTKAAKEPSSADRVVLKAGGVQVTQSDFEAWMDTLDMKKDGDENPDRQALGDNYASVLMLSKQAIANHLAGQICHLGPAFDFPNFCRGKREFTQRPPVRTEASF